MMALLIKEERSTNYLIGQVRQRAQGYRNKNLITTEELWKARPKLKTFAVEAQKLLDSNPEPSK